MHELLLRFGLTVLVVVILLPVCFVVATPIIIFGAPFSRQPYLEALKNGYRNTFDFWRNIAEAIPVL